MNEEMNEEMMQYLFNKDPVELTISGCKKEHSAIVLSFKEVPYRWEVDSLNESFLFRQLGNEIGDWIGRGITLFLSITAHRTLILASIGEGGKK